MVGAWMLHLGVRICGCGTSLPKMKDYSALWALPLPLFLRLGGMVERTVLAPADLPIHKKSPHPLYVYFQF
jgi:hypothetical protein